MSLTMKFEEFGIEMDFGPADVELNPLFHAASMALIQPYTFAAQVGRISKERSTELLMRAYAEGVVFQTTPEMTREEVFQFFVKHPTEFTILREYAEHGANFEDESSGETDELQGPGHQVGEGS